MRYAMPYFPLELEIPDDWLTDVGMSAFTPATRAYRS
jgi:hypothetical protein